MPKRRNAATHVAAFSSKGVKDPDFPLVGTKSNMNRRGKYVFLCSIYIFPRRKYVFQGEKYINLSLKYIFRREIYINGRLIYVFSPRVLLDFPACGVAFRARALIFNPPFLRLDER